LGGYFYLGAFVLGGGLNYETVYDAQVAAGQTSEEKHTTQLWSPDVTAGLRHETFEMVGTYHLRSYYDDGVARPLRWGQASLRLRSVLEDQFYWRLEGYTVVGGGGASCNFEAYPSQDLGVWLSGFYEQGQIYVNSSTDYHRQGASVGVGWWSSHRFELQLSLDISTVKRTDGLGSALTTGAATMTVLLRAPERYQAADPAVAPPAEPLPTSAQSPPQPMPAEVAPPVEVNPAGDVTGPVQPAPPGRKPSAPARSSRRFQPVRNRPGDLACWHSSTCFAEPHPGARPLAASASAPATPDGTGSTRPTLQVGCRPTGYNFHARPRLVHDCRHLCFRTVQRRTSLDTVAAGEGGTTAVGGATGTGGTHAAGGVARCLPSSPGRVSLAFVMGKRRPASRAHRAALLNAAEPRRQTPDVPCRDS
jgi:hypothetical protein